MAPLVAVWKVINSPIFDIHYKYWNSSMKFGNCESQFSTEKKHLQASWGAERRWITWQEEPGGGWRSAGVFGENFWSLVLFSIKKPFFIHLGAREWLGLAWTSFWLTSWKERRLLGRKWKFCYLNCFVVVFYIVSAWYGLVAKVLANKWEKILNKPLIAVDRPVKIW